MVKDPDDHPDRRDVMGKEGGKELGVSAPSLGTSLPPQTSTYSASKSFPNSVLWGFLWRLQHVGMMDHLLNPFPAALPSLE